MNELLPYEPELAQKLQSLPLPDFNMAWTDMQRRLDEDDDDSILPFWLRGCALWVLLGIVLLGISWWLLQPQKWFTKKQPAKNTTTIIIKENKKDGQNKTISNDTLATSSNLIAINKKDTSIEKQYPKQDSTERQLNKPEEEINKQGTKNIGNDKPGIFQKRSLKKKIITLPGHLKINTTNEVPDEAGDQNEKHSNEKNNKKNIAVNNNDTKNNETDSNSTIEPDNPVTAKQQPSITKSNIINNIDSSHSISLDSTQKKSTDSTQKKNQLKQKPTINKQKNDSSKTKPITFSIGIAMNQQIPVDGQQLISYNAEGRKGTLADYIPSIYVRMYKANKWFIQGEFRYGAPQATKDILYQQKNQFDTAGAPLQQYATDTSIHLKKTYYQQFPVTFNYFITSKLSLGTGFIFNKFYSAVSEQIINQHNNFTGKDSILNEAVFNSKKADSNFVSTYIQATFEAQYKWKKLSFGLRYAFGLQPYIKFTLPGGSEQQEKNQSFLLFIRYELWRSKKK